MPQDTEGRSERQGGEDMNLPVCWRCKTRMRCLKNDVVVREEGDGFYYNCDLYECEDCGAIIAAGFGQGFEGPVMQKHIPVIRHRREEAALVSVGNRPKANTAKEERKETG